MSQVSPYDSSLFINTPNGEMILSEYQMYADPDDPSITIKAEHIVKEGETLQSIAYQYYGDSGYWTRILSYNRIINPFNLEPYTRLFIPN